MMVVVVMMMIMFVQVRDITEHGQRRMGNPVKNKGGIYESLCESDSR